jgi:hypothetical protein
LRACVVKTPGHNHAREIGAGVLDFATHRGLRLDEQ